MLTALGLGCSLTVDTNGNGDNGEEGGTNPPQESRYFDVNMLVTDMHTEAPTEDPNLVNPWGLAFGDETFFWVANNGTSTSTLYDADGRIRSDLVGGPIALPMPETATPYGDTGEAEESGPTGIVYNEGDKGFTVENGVASQFIFATTGGTLLAWSSHLQEPHSAVIAVDNSGEEASYTGLAIATSLRHGRLLYAANFAGAMLETYDENFDRVDLTGGNFVDTSLPAGYSPFNVQALDGRIYVTYALQDEEDPTEEVKGAGNGFVTVFSPDGQMIARIASQGRLDAPWGLAIAPDGFGHVGGSLLVGNFGDGRITAYDLDTHESLGQLATAAGHPIMIEGLWALAFGNDAKAGESEDLYFTAGPGEEMHGIFGEIAVKGSEDDS